MPFLIDGHNVISALPDVDLSDPHDEAKLVLKLRRWAARTRRQATVVFDGGVPGGYSRSLSGGGLEVVFAARRYTDADRIIKSRLRHLPDAPNWTVVSSDHEVREAARRVGARTLTAEAFVKRLEDGPRPTLEKPTSISEEEVQAWLEVFGAAERGERGKREAPSLPVAGGKRQGRPKAPSRRSQRTLGEQVGWTEPTSHEEPPIPSPEGKKPLESSPEEVAYWLEVFGDGAAEVPPPKPPRRLQPKGEPTVEKDHPEAQSEADIEAWLEVFSAAEPREEAPPGEQLSAKRSGRSKTLREHKRRRGDGFTDKAEGLSEEDIELWQRLFGEEPEE
ncbi:MAG: NYN domain-containing protein [Anaerolineae bacterium]